MENTEDALFVETVVCSEKIHKTQWENVFFFARKCGKMILTENMGKGDFLSKIWENAENAVSSGKIRKTRFWWKNMENEVCCIRYGKTWFWRKNRFWQKMQKTWFCCRKYWKHTILTGKRGFNKKIRVWRENNVGGEKCGEHDFDGKILFVVWREKRNSVVLAI